MLIEIINLIDGYEAEPLILNLKRRSFILPTGRYLHEFLLSISIRDYIAAIRNTYCHFSNKICSKTARYSSKMILFRIELVRIYQFKTFVNKINYYSHITTNYLTPSVS